MSERKRGDGDRAVATGCERLAGAPRWRSTPPAAPPHSRDADVAIRMGAGVCGDAAAALFGVNGARPVLESHAGGGATGGAAAAAAAGDDSTALPFGPPCTTRCEAHGRRRASSAAQPPTAVQRAPLRCLPRRPVARHRRFRPRRSSDVGQQRRWRIRRRRRAARRPTKIGECRPRRASRQRITHASIAIFASPRWSPRARRRGAAGSASARSVAEADRRLSSRARRPRAGARASAALRWPVASRSDVACARVRRPRPRRFPWAASSTAARAARGAPLGAARADSRMLAPRAAAAFGGFGGPAGSIRARAAAAPGPAYSRPAPVARRRRLARRVLQCRLRGAVALPRGATAPRTARRARRWRARAAMRRGRRGRRRSSRRRRGRGVGGRVIGVCCGARPFRRRRARCSAAACRRARIVRCSWRRRRASRLDLPRRRAEIRAPRNALRDGWRAAPLLGDAPSRPSRASGSTSPCRRRVAHVVSGAAKPASRRLAALLRCPEGAVRFDRRGRGASARRGAAPAAAPMATCRGRAAGTAPARGRAEAPGARRGRPRRCRRAPSRGRHPLPFLRLRRLGCDTSRRGGVATGVPTESASRGARARAPRRQGRGHKPAAHARRRERGLVQESLAAS